MKKPILIMLCIAMLVMTALSVFANVSPYLSSGVQVRPASRPQVRSIAGCNVNIESSPGDIYFMGKARQECVDKNRHNANCQKHCFEQVKLMTRGTMMNEPLGAYSRYGCKEIDALNVKTRSQCFFEASNACNIANPGHNYCIKRCVQKAYHQCRQSVMSQTRGSA